MRIIYIKTIIADSGAVYDGKIRADGVPRVILDINAALPDVRYS